MHRLGEPGGGTNPGAGRQLGIEGGGDAHPGGLPVGEVGGELGGHFVTGHIDGVGRITRWERAGQDHVLDIAAPREVMRYVVFKGSMAVDGISLTRKLREHPKFKTTPILILTTESSDAMKAKAAEGK